MSDNPMMTFGIIKPDAVRAGNAGAIIQRITDKGFKIRAMKMLHMSRPVAEGFYAVADECTHDGEPIHTGRVRGEEIICTRHGARFHLHTGAVVAPPAIVPIETFQLKVEGNDILVYLE